MKNITLRSSLFLLFSMVAFIHPLSAKEPSYPNIDNQKIYISPNELVFTQEGIFLLHAQELIPIDAIFSDREGIFIIDPLKYDKITDTCPNGHKIYHLECGGCAWWYCNFRCKCYSPWGYR
jgi:hypothetical protein